MVYDCTQLLNELDLLEIRLNILDPYVDFFVIGQSIETFSGKEKPLYFHKEDKRWDKWRNKIIDVVIPTIETDDSFVRSGYQKDYLRTALEECEPEDVIVYGDIDEIWNVDALRGYDLEAGFKLRQLAYSYYLNMRSSEDWIGTNVFLYKNIKNLNEIRADHSNILENGGWHFTNMGGVEQIIKKLESYDHQEYNLAHIKDSVAEKMKNGQDYIGRAKDWKGNEFKMWIDEVDLPKYIRDNKEKWIKLFQS